MLIEPSYAKTYIPNYRTSGQTGIFNGVYYFYAVDINTLRDIPGYPILIDGSVAQNDDRKYFVGGTILQRPSLLQLGNYVYAGFGGHCDLFNYTGTVIGVDVVQKKIIANFVTEAGPRSPQSNDWQKGNGGEAGIWQGGLGLASDGPRFFFVTVSIHLPARLFGMFPLIQSQGNGQGHENQGTPATGQSGLRTLGEAVVNLNVAADGTVSVVDYFQPYDYQNLDGGDQDFGKLTFEP